MGLSADNISGVPGPKMDPDLMTIYTGGENFLSRMTALVTAKENAAAALAELQLGQSTKAANEDAIQKQIAATKALDDANRKVADIVSAATARAEQIVSNAALERDKLISDAATANQGAAAALSEAAQIKEAARKDADATKAAAAEIKAQAEATLTAAKQTQAEAVSSKAAADKAASDADNVRKDFLGRIAILQAAIARANETIS